MSEGNSFDRLIFDAGFKLDGTHLVAASAGTGKTYNIQNIYARIIMEKGFEVSQIQVMTFTEAATKELKDRLHSILRDLQRRFAGQDCEAKNEGDMIRRNQRADRLVACVADKAKARRCVELALLDFDNAAITTIHGFCQRVLTRYAFETGINLDMTIEDNKMDDLKRLATDWWRRNPDAESYGFELKVLIGFTQTLGGKAVYDIVNDDDSKGDGFALKIAAQLVKDYDAALPQREKQNFDDLLRALWNALRGENGRELAEKLRQDFKAALIDEFQDTDPIQYDIFRRIFLEGGLPLFFVGDPKQAIYSFRSGDIFTYMNACGIEGLQKHTLNTNFRSTRRLVDAVNAMFRDTADENGAIKYTFSNKEIDYSGSVRVEREPDIKGPDLEQPFRIITVHIEKTSGNRAPNMTEIRSRLEPVLVRQVLAVLSERDSDGKRIFSPRDIAILLNAHTEENNLQKMLRAVGIPSVIARAGNVFETAAAWELKAILEAVLFPYGAALRNGLLTVFGGMSPEELENLENTEAMAEKAAFFRELGNTWQRRGFHALVSELEALGYQRRIAEKEDGERMLTDMEQLFELCFAAIKKMGPSTEKLLDWLNQRILKSNGDENDSEEFKRELEKDGDAVRIMSIFISKGLQFPVVFLPECWNLTNWNDKRNQFKVPYYHADGPERRLTFELGAGKAKDKAKEKAKEELLQEKMRLLYVAMTRAIQRTIMIIPEISLLKQCEPFLELRAKAEGVPSILWQKAEELPPPGVDMYELDQTQAPQSKEAREPARFDLSPSKGSYSSLVPAASVNDESEDKDNDSQDSLEPVNADKGALMPIFSIRGGSRIGTCWHNVMERIPFDASDGELRRIAADELSSSGYRTDDEQGQVLLRTTADMLRKVLDYVLVSPSGERFCLSRIPWERRLSEQEFNFCSAEAVDTCAELQKIIAHHWHGDEKKSDFIATMENWDRKVPRGFMTGFIDLIFQQGDFFYVVDWKSNIMDGSRDSFNEAGVRREMARHGYFFQYLLYSAVLHRYLRETLGEAYSWQRNFGGVRYYFMRGVAAGAEAPVFEDRPSEALLDALCSALGMK